MRASAVFYLLLALVFLAHSAVVACPSNDLPSDLARHGTAINETPFSEVDKHKYIFREFRPRHDPKGSFRQPYFAFKILFRIKDGTEEIFHRHWKTVHADLTLSQVDFALRVQRYVQYHQDKESRSKVQRLLTAANGSMQLAPYDGIAEFHTKDHETFEKFLLSVFADPLLVGDQQNFVKAGPPLHVMAGYENLIFGSGIDTSKGYDGILPGDRRFRYSKDT